MFKPPKHFLRLGFLGVPNSHRCSPGMTGGWLGCLEIHPVGQQNMKLAIGSMGMVYLPTFGDNLCRLVI